MTVIEFPNVERRLQIDDRVRKIKDRIETAIGDEQVDDVVEALTILITNGIMYSSDSKDEAQDYLKSVSVAIALNIKINYERFWRFINNRVN